MSDCIYRWWWGANLSLKMFTVSRKHSYNIAKELRNVKMELAVSDKLNRILSDKLEALQKRSVERDAILTAVITCQPCCHQLGYLGMIYVCETCRSFYCPRCVGIYSRYDYSCATCGAKAAPSRSLVAENIIQ